MSSTFLSESVVIDTGPLIALAHLNWFSELLMLFGTAHITEQVFLESQCEPERMDARCIVAAVNSNKLTSSNCMIADISKYPGKLGTGEISSIELAISLRCPVILDDKHARRYAQKLGIPVVGTAGILIYAKQNHVINSVTHLLQQLREKQYYLSDNLIKKIKQLSGE